MANKLIPPKALDITPQEERVRKVELLDKNETALLDLQYRKAEIEGKRNRLDIETKEKNLTAVEEINKNIDELMKLVSDPIMAAQIAGKVETGKDYNEFVKAVAAVAKLRDDLLDRTDSFSGDGKAHKKFAVAFQTQDVSIMVGINQHG